jgi:alpha-galactosidase
MKYAYFLNLDGNALGHECTYHTAETLADGTVRRIFTRAHGQAELALTCDEDATGAICCVLRVKNSGGAAIRLSRADVGISLDVSASADTGAGLEIDYFTSDWGAEYTPARKRLEGPFQFGCVSGRSCKGFIPWVGVAEAPAGPVYAMTLGWSGNWRCVAAPWPSGYCDHRPYTYTVTMGLGQEDFYTDIPAGGIFSTPPVYVARGVCGENCAAALRRYFKRRLSVVDEALYSPMPTEFNTWWPYEDKKIDAEVYQRNASIAKELGLDYATMDAGWFGDPDVANKTWYEKRGDWALVNTQRFPEGMKAMCDGAKAIGVKPGLWCEIEAVGVDAELRKARGGIMARRGGRDLGYVCFGDAAGRAWAMDVADKILGEYGAEWIKFDFNLDPGAGCDCEEHSHGRGDGLLAHYTGYYAFLDEVRRKYPGVVVENCASGGLRADIAMLSHTHWTHLSDPDSTEFHLQLFWGALSFLHQSALLHFSHSEMVDGRTPLTPDMPPARFDYIIRAVMMGVPGFSYQLDRLADWQRDRLGELVRFYKRISADYILKGEARRLTPQPLVNGKGERFPVFQFMSQAGDALMFAFRLTGAPAERRVFMHGLDEAARYSLSFDSGGTMEIDGRTLTREGVVFAGLPEEGSAVAEVVRI